MSRQAVLTWDWSEQPDLDELARAVEDLSGGAVHLYNVDTGSDQFALVIADEPIGQRAADEIYRTGVWP